MHKMNFKVGKYNACRNLIFNKGDRKRLSTEDVEEDYISICSSHKAITCKPDIKITAHK